MPTVRVETNLDFEFFPSQFMTLFLYFLADLFGKDKQLMKYVFDTDKRMSMVSVPSFFFKGNGIGWPIFLLFTSTIYSP